MYKDNNFKICLICKYNNTYIKKVESFYSTGFDYIHYCSECDDGFLTEQSDFNYEIFCHILHYNFWRG